ncbi:hypothetical protein Pmani_006280 [Petrolisthes manimaculis]|uniref:Uncharacterized protein n=1 Tax=Petrolisthes manimaculis TaxID=1843537 RepID=A0AAE1QAN7_9EUCA|nr:hypothetical protein Pmani_006280 [Petrolisthes manimaculis]
MQQLIEATDIHEKETIKTFWSKYNIKNAIDINHAWQEVKESTMNGSWKKLWKECVNDFAGFRGSQGHHETLTSGWVQGGE